MIVELTDADQEKLAYSPEEAIALTGIPRGRLWRAIGSGALVARRYGGLIVILREDLAAFLRDLPVRPVSRTSNMENHHVDRRNAAGL